MCKIIFNIQLQIEMISVVNDDRLKLKSIQYVYDKWKFEI